MKSCDFDHYLQSVSVPTEAEKVDFYMEYFCSMDMNEEVPITDLLWCHGKIIDVSDGSDNQKW